MLDGTLLPLTDPARLAGAAFLARYNGGTRAQYQMDLNCFWSWCDSNSLPPLLARRPHIELYIRWLEETRGLKPATVSRRLSTLVGYYRYAAIDQVIETSPAEYVRRPKVPVTPRPTLDRMELSAFLQSARAGTPSEWALSVLLGILALRVSEACNLSIEDQGLERGHRTVLIAGKGGTLTTMPCPPPVFRALDAAGGERTSGPLLLARSGERMDRYAATRAVQRIAKRAGITRKMHPHLLRHASITAALDAGVPLRDVQILARHSDPRTTTRYDQHRQNLDRHASYVLAAFVAGG